MSTKGSINTSIKNEKLLKFVNYVMQGGKKSLALKIISNALEEIRSKGYKNPEEVFDKAIENIMPKIEVRPKRVGGSIYQVPQEVKPRRQFALATRWILQSVRQKKGQDFARSLSQELIEAFQETGNAFKKKLDVYKMAESNKAFARFANK
ncbi:30S ribosomal protein S7 [Candidatus Gracilibacteria bacterium]|nr:30S ribosomal protein S7 [Candidatus Gracilibacteria bacterium]